jgi:hypothetical protein
VQILQPVSIKQISVAGAQVESTFPLHVDSLHEFRLRLAGQSVVVQGRVAYSRISDVDPEQVLYHSGIEFVEVPPRIREVFERFIEGLKAARARS